MDRVRTVLTLMGVAASGLLLAASSASAQEMSLAFQAGHVTLVARDMTVPGILDRWARVGGTAIVNGDAVAGGPVTLQLIDVPERDALEILLRAAAGYLVAERADARPSASAISRILILPRSRVPPPVSAAAAFDHSDMPSEQTPDVPSAAAAPPFSVAPGVGQPSIAVVGQAPGASPTIRSAVIGSARPGEAIADPTAVSQQPSPATARPGETPPPPPTVRQSLGPNGRPQ
jgi:hypothetical protein